MSIYFRLFVCNSPVWLYMLLVFVVLFQNIISFEIHLNAFTLI